MSKTITKEGVQVEVGQRWRCLESERRMLTPRTVTVERVDALNGQAIVRTSNGAVSRISIKRMHKHGTGFALIAGATP